MGGPAPPHVGLAGIGKRHHEGGVGQVGICPAVQQQPDPGQTLCAGSRQEACYRAATWNSIAFRPKRIPARAASERGVACSLSSKLSEAPALQPTQMASRTRASAGLTGPPGLPLSEGQ
jgi:hypothetical protein